MPTLQVHLREGFEGERVVVVVGDRTVLDAPDVRTRMQLGLAQIVEAEVPDAPTTVRVEVPGRARTCTLTVDPGRTPTIGVSIDARGEIDAVPTAETLGYV